MSLSEMRSKVVERGFSLRENRWEKLEELTEFSVDELGLEQADRHRVLEQLIRDFFDSNTKVQERFREWQKAKESNEE